MSTLATRIAGAAAAGIDGRINAILVKDARQAVQSRLVTMVILLLVLANGLITCISLVAVDHSQEETAGMTLFGYLFILTIINGAVIIPLYTSIRLSIERNDSNMDLLYITTITAGSIVRGKWLAASALTLLVFSASGPFIMLSYLLRGIDVPTIALLLLLGLLVSWFLNLAGIAVGCVRGNMLVRMVLMLAFVILIFWLVFGMMISMADSIFLSIMGVDAESWAGLGTVAAFVLMVAALIYMFARAMLSPPSSNRMMPLRVSLMIVWFVTLALMALWAINQQDVFYAQTWIVGWVVVFSAAMLLGAGEREQWLPRVRRHIPQNIFGRLGFFLISTGGGSGVLWSLLLGLATLLVGATLTFIVEESFHVNTHARTIRTAASVLIMMYCYIMMAVLFRRLVMKRASTTSIPVLALAAQAVLTLVPVLVGYAISTGKTLPLVYWIGSMGLLTLGRDARPEQAVQLGLACFAASVLTVVNLGWWWAHWSRFQRYKPETAKLFDVMKPQSLDVVMAEAPAAVLVENLSSEDAGKDVSNE